jgi:hypothetical protein
MSSVCPPYLQATTVVSVHAITAWPMSYITSWENAGGLKTNDANG